MNANNAPRPNQEARRVLHEVKSNNVEYCVAVFNGVTVAAFTTIKYICDALRDNFFVHTISFSRCDLPTHHVEEIASALGCQDKLQSLDFSYNTIGTDRIPNLSRHLHAIPSLIRLNLEGTDLRDEGVIAIAQHLLNHPTLDALNLARNSIRGSAALILARALMSSTLSWLDISHNPITNDAAYHLLLAQHRRQKYLRLDLHCIHPHMLQAATALNMQWEAAHNVELQNEIHQPGPAHPGQGNMPPPPFPTLVHHYALRDHLLESHNNRGAEPEVLWVQQGEPPQLVSPNQGDLPIVPDVVTDPGTSHYDVAAWQGITRAVTDNFHESCLVGQTNAFQVYRCQGHDIAATPLEGQLLLRRINPSATREALNLDDEMADFMSPNMILHLQDDTYVPMLCVVLPQYGNIYQFFLRRIPVIPQLAG